MAFESERKFESGLGRMRMSDNEMLDNGQLTVTGILSRRIGCQGLRVPTLLNRGMLYTYGARPIDNKSLPS